MNEFSEKVSFYIMNSVSNFKSPWNEIRCNAVLFAGYLLGHLDKEKQSILSKEHISNGNSLFENEIGGFGIYLFRFYLNKLWSNWYKKTRHRKSERKKP